MFPIPEKLCPDVPVFAHRGSDISPNIYLCAPCFSYRPIHKNSSCGEIFYNIDYFFMDEEYIMCVSEHYVALR